MKRKRYSDKLAIAANQKVKEREYWLTKMTGDLSKSSFLYDYKKNGNEYSPDSLNVSLPFSLSSQLLKISNRSDHTLHMILTAGLITLLFKYSALSDILLGTPIYKQDTEKELINTVLVLRNQVDNDMTFKQLLVQVRQTVIDAVKHYSYPIEVLADELNIPIGNGAFSLFDVAIILENIQDKNYMGDITPNLMFCFNRNADMINGILEYNAQLYRSESIQRIARHYISLLQTCISGLDKSLTDAHILTEEEKSQILICFNDTQKEFHPDQTIVSLFEKKVAETPEKPAIFFEEKKLTYQQLNEDANRYAAFLKEKGVCPDRIVAIMLEPSLDRVAAILGILKAGGAYLPIDPDYPKKRIMKILADSEASILISSKHITNNFTFTALENIDNIRSKPFISPPRPPIKNFDGLPLVNRTLVDYGKYHDYIGIAMGKHTVSLQATRGCPYNCAYCHKIWPKKHVVRSAENIFKEIRNCYEAGVSRIVFIDDIFNLDIKNSTRLLEYVVKDGMDVQLFFPNGLRGDILTRDFIDLMIEAGTVNVDLALETASPRLQKLIGKNLNVDRFRDNVFYFAEKYPQVVLEMEMMIGFPTETEEEALMTFDFLKSVKWLHFPNLNILKVFPNTDMYRLAIANGIPDERIQRSTNLPYHQLPDTLPFPKEFVREFQSRFVNEYFMSKERLLSVLPQQTKNFTEDEIILKYDSYLPVKINTFKDIIDIYGISSEELGELKFLPTDYRSAFEFDEKIKKYFPIEKKNEDALRVLFIDLSLLFSFDSANTLYDVIEEPIGLMNLVTYLNEQFGPRVNGKVVKSRIDFDGFDYLKPIIDDFKPHFIGLRTLTLYKEYLHHAVALIRQWGYNGAIGAGGPYATSDFQLALQDDGLDLVVFGEGEHTCAELVEKMISNDNRLPNDNVLAGIQGLAFVKQEDKALLKTARRDVLLLEEIDPLLLRHSTENNPLVNKPEDLLYLISTSGSTGEPKSVMLEHRNMVNLMNSQFADGTVDFSGRVLHFTSIGFDVSAQEIFSTLLSGGQLFIINNRLKGDILELFHFIDGNNVNVVFLPPSFLKMIFTHPDFAADFPLCVKHIITAGEQLIVPDPLKRHLKEHQVHLHNHYGPSETHVVTTLTIDPSKDIPSLPSIGRPIANTSILILDGAGDIQPIGIMGELYISGANVGRGYFKRDDSTAERYMHNPFIKGERMYRTGDLARWLSDGTIEFLGRADHQVKIRGFRVELGEIENRLMTHHKVKEAVVIDDRDEKGEAHLCAYYVPASTDDQEDPVDGSMLRDFLTDELPDYMVPFYYIKLQSIPLTPNGKVDKKALPQAGGGIDAEYHAPSNEIEEKLAEIWSDILEIDKERISTEANFFKLGGHSLKATILVATIHKELNTRIPLAEIFTLPTIRQMAQYISDNETEAYTAVTLAPKSDFYPLSFNQERLWIISQMEPDSAAYHMSGRVTLDHVVSGETVKRALHSIIGRHESFRTGFKTVNETAVQFILEDATVSLEEIDLSALPPAEKERERVRVYRESVSKPFDLGDPPLLRAVLVKLSHELYDLIISIHHITADGWSLQLLKKEFASFYDAARNGRTIEMALPALHYKDFAVWQNLQLQDSALKEKSHLFWLQKLEEGMPGLELPADFVSAGSDITGMGYRFVVENDTREALNKLCKENRTTLFGVMFSAYNILLFLMTGNRDIVCGIISAGRDDPALKNIIGYFINLVVLKSHVDPGQNFRDFLAHVGGETLRALQHQGYPLERVLDDLKMRFPDVKTAFNLVNLQNSDRELHPDDFTTFHTDDVPDVKFDVELFVTEHKNGIEIYFNYKKAMFKTETIAYIAGEYHKLLKEIAAQPGKIIGESTAFRLGDLEVKGNTVEPLNDFIPFEKINDSLSTIRHRFEDQVEKYPGYTAVKTVDRTYTYRELNESADRIARSIHRICRETAVGVSLLFGHGAEMIAGMIGVLKSGNYYVPLDPTYPSKRLTYVLKDSLTRIILTNTNNLDYARVLTSEAGGDIQYINIDDIDDGSPVEIPGISVNPDDWAYILYTSGSTGVPKGVIQNHRNVLHFIRVYTNNLHIHSGDRLALFASYSFDAAVMGIYGALLNGAILYPLDIKQEDNLSRLPQWLGEEKITIYHSIPTVFRFFTDMLNGSETFPHLRLVVMGGEAVNRRDVEIYKTRFSGDCIFINGLGPTESTVTLQYFIDKNTTLSRESVPVGYPVRETDVFLVDSNNCEARVFGVGEIVYKSSYLALGYCNNPGKTHDAFGEDPIHGGGRVYRSGDLGRRLPDGSIEYAGRADFQVKIRGYRVELGEIESILDDSTGIKKSAVVCFQDNNGDNYLAAYYVKEQDVDESALMRSLKEALPGYMVPAVLLNVENMPLTPSGKINRAALPKPAAGLFTVKKKYAAPTNWVEKKMVEIWADVLGLETDDIGIDADFFEIGGHSLKATNFITKLHKAFNVKVPLGELFQTPTIRELAQYISRLSVPDAGFCPIEPAEKRDYYPLSSAQKRLFVIQQMESGNVTYNIPKMIPISGKTGMEKIENTFRQLIRRHESLRTSFHMVDDEPVQRVHDDVQFNVEQLTAGDGPASFFRSFDLTQPPLFRAGVMEDGPNLYMLLVDMHHIISDGNSNAVLEKDFFALYSGNPPDPLRIQYKDFSQWQNSGMEMKNLQLQEQFWLKQFEGPLPKLNLPIDFQRPEIVVFAGDSIRFNLGREENTLLNKIALKEGVTLYMLLLSLVYVFLSKLSGQEDIVVGTPVAGRMHADLEPLIGMFVNTLALRNRPEGGKTFDDFLHELKKRTLKALDNQDYQFEDLVDRLLPARDSGRNPLFDVLYTLITTPSAARVEKDASEEPNQPEQQTQGFQRRIAKFDLEIVAFERPENIGFVFEYNTKLFKKETIERFTSYLKTIITTVLENPNVKLADIEIIDKDQRKKLLKKLRKNTDPHFLDADEPNASAINDDEGEFDF